MKNNKIKVLHFLSHGQIGGQERAIYQLLKAFQNDDEFQIGIAITQNKRHYVSKIKELNISVINLQLNTGFSYQNSNKKVIERAPLFISFFH